MDKFPLRFLGDWPPQMLGFSLDDWVGSTSAGEVISQPNCERRSASSPSLRRSSLALGVLLALVICPALLLAQPNRYAGVETSEGKTTETESKTESRSEILIQKRREKSRHLASPSEHWLLPYLKGFERKGSSSIQEANYKGFHPRFDTVARGSGPALGVRYWRPHALGPLDLMGSAFYSWYRYQLYDLQIGFIPNRGKRIPSKSFENDQIEQLGDVERSDFSRFKLYVSGRFRDRTDESLYGQGPFSKQEDLLRYRLKETLLELVSGYQVNDNLGLTLKIGTLNHTLERGRSSPPLQDSPNAADFPGFVGTPNYLRIHGSAVLDYRDDPGIPHSGFLAAAGWEIFENTNVSDRYDFNRFSLDLRGFIPGGSRQRVIALRGFLVNSDAGEEAEVPFFLQPSLGGGESLRGYDSFRFRGDKLMLLQAEYRWEASPRLELALFGESGTVALKGEQLSLDALKSDWGLGLRFKSSRGILIRIDQAFSNEGPRTQVRLSRAF